MALAVPGNPDQGWLTLKVTTERIRRWGAPPNVGGGAYSRLMRFGFVVPYATAREFTELAAAGRAVRLGRGLHLGGGLGRARVGRPRGRRDGDRADQARHAAHPGLAVAALGPRVRGRHRGPAQRGPGGDDRGPRRGPRGLDRVRGRRGPPGPRGEARRVPGHLRRADARSAVPVRRQALQRAPHRPPGAGTAGPAAAAAGLGGRRPDRRPGRAAVAGAGRALGRPAARHLRQARHRP